MMQPTLLELEVQELMRESERRHTARRLLALARQGQPRAGMARQTVAFLGRQLVKLGSRLQGAGAPAYAGSNTASTPLSAGATGVALAA